MNREALLQLTKEMIDELEYAHSLTKEQRVSNAVKARLRAARMKAASIHYHLQENAPEGFWTRLKGFLKELA